MSLILYIDEICWRKETTKENRNMKKVLLRTSIFNLPATGTLAYDIRWYLYSEIKGNANIRVYVWRARSRLCQSQILEVIILQEYSAVFAWSTRCTYLRISIARRVLWMQRKWQRRWRGASEIRMDTARCKQLPTKLHQQISQTLTIVSPTFWPTSIDSRQHLSGFVKICKRLTHSQTILIIH